MAEIKYFGSDNNGSFVRPLNYTFPAGLNAVGSNISVSYLVVAGGGGGGSGQSAVAGGGGGAGGYLTSSNTISPNLGYDTNEL